MCVYSVGIFVCGMCVCVCIYVYLSVYLNVYLCSLCVCLYVCLGIYVCEHACVCMCVFYHIQILRAATVFCVQSGRVEQDLPLDYQLTGVK